jgi:hypothetical protein
MIHLDNRRSMFKLETPYDTKVFRHYDIIDPSTIEKIVEDETVKREHYGFSYQTHYLNTPTIDFIRTITSDFLDMFNYNHKKHVWYMDVIRYNLSDDTEPVSSGLEWHCENDNYPNLITVLLYLRVDKDILNGDLGYMDSHGVAQKIMIDTGTIIIMDGRVVHLPDNPIGSGKRDLIAVSFEKY